MVKMSPISRPTPDKLINLASEYFKKEKIVSKNFKFVLRKNY